MPTTTTLTASQQGWQSQYEALKAQQYAYKAQADALAGIPSDLLTSTQTILLQVAQYKQVEVETQLGNLQTNFHLDLTNRLNSVDVTLAGMTSTDPARTQVLSYQATVLQAKIELDAVAQSWVIPDPGLTTYTIDSVRYSNGNPPQPVGWAYALDTVKNYAVGAVSGVVNIVDNSGVVITNITNWISTLDPKLQYQVCKNNWDNAGTVMGATLPAALGIPSGLVGKIVDKAIGNANDYAFSIGAVACKSIMPQTDLLSFFQNELGTIPADVQYALDSFGPQLEFTFSPDIAAQLAAEAAVSSAVNRTLSAYPAAPASVLLAEANQAYGNTMTDWSSNPAAVFGSTSTDSATTQSTLVQSIAHPTGLQALTKGLTTTIDALAFIKAIQSGEPLPVVTSGLRLANTLSTLDGSAPNYNLSGASNVGSGILSLMSLDAALKRGDTVGTIIAGAQTLSYGVQAYISFAGGTANVSSSVNNLNTTLNGSPGAPGVIAYLNLANSIANGDALGSAMSVMSMFPATAPIAYAYYAFQLVTSLFGGSDAPPEAWGSASATWSGFNAVANAAGAYGGLESATQTYNGVLSYLDQLVAQEQALNPGAAIGIVANRLPSLSYRNYSGYSITDIDPLTGVQRNPGVLYDLTGRPYNAPAGSVQASQSLSERMIRVALERGAVAPLWEVQTAALQTQMGDPMAGLTEEERAGRAGLLAPSPQPSPASGGGSQMFRAVALDLNGDGVQTTGTNKTVAFDVDNSGYLKNTAWLNNNDGFLFLDRNLNGQIDAGSELFSNSAVALGERGLAGMRWIDSNYDGSISALDPVWNELKVWQDANGNGTADAGETKTLAQLGITSLNYAMGTFERNGQLSQLSSPDLAADTGGTRTHVVPEGIIIQSSNGHTSLLATRIDDRSAIEANRDGITGYEDTELIVSAADLLANDTLAGFSGANLSIGNVSNFTHGTGFLDTNGFIHYTPDANYSGAASFDYTVQAITGQKGAANDGDWLGERRAA